MNIDYKKQNEILKRNLNKEFIIETEDCKNRICNILKSIGYNINYNDYIITIDIAYDNVRKAIYDFYEMEIQTVQLFKIDRLYEAMVKINEIEPDVLADELGTIKIDLISKKVYAINESTIKQFKELLNYLINSSNKYLDELIKTSLKYERRKIKFRSTINIIEEYNVSIEKIKLLIIFLRRAIKGLDYIKEEITKFKNIDVFKI